MWIPESPRSGSRSGPPKHPLAKPLEVAATLDRLTIRALRFDIDGPSDRLHVGERRRKHDTASPAEVGHTTPARTKSG